ncbi:hypothetical protein BpHYR1_051300 [Brachionus plicatilis]|uniref:Uncharacterized protein n=1 Tax=Brachionus plicatilis TaxID=10195 RepID=A0A3M7T1G2_BRAPC|nr:hypothetical protein BpHYR1_051300 [Brachionus plicatilis]
MYPEEIVPTLVLIQIKAMRARQYRLKKRQNAFIRDISFVDKAVLKKTKLKFRRVAQVLEKLLLKSEEFSRLSLACQPFLIIEKSSQDFFLFLLKYTGCQKIAEKPRSRKISKPSCIGVREKSSLKLFTSNLNQHSYKYILEYYLLPFVRTKFSREELDRCFLIQDNARSIILTYVLAF